MDLISLDRELSRAFCGGELLRRELRLTDEQAHALADRYPVTVQPMGEQWYTVTFEGAYQIGT